MRPPAFPFHSRAPEIPEWLFDAIVPFLRPKITSPTTLQQYISTLLTIVLALGLIKTVYFMNIQVVAKGKEYKTHR